MPQLLNNLPETVMRRPQSSSLHLRLGIVCDFVEENWPSMDLIGDMLVSHLGNGSPMGIEAERIRPAMSRRFSTVAAVYDAVAAVYDRRVEKAAFNADRLFSRFWHYPRFLRRCRESFDIFHVVDHSYAQLVLELPPGQTLVTCHDLDTFRCLLEPDSEPRSVLFQAMVRRTLRGLRKAALVVCPSFATRDALLTHTLVAEDRLRVVPNGAHPSCSPEADPLADAEVARWLGERSAGDADLLHVGSTVPRKRIDVLLRVFAEVKQRFPGTRLIRAGGPFTAEQESMADDLRLRDSIVVLPQLDRRFLAAVYRRAALVLLTSEREGFGLPVLEAMACATPVVASDLPSVREVGGNSAVYCRISRIPEWADAICGLLHERRDDFSRWQTRRAEAVTRAALFSWDKYALEMVKLYREVAGGIPGGLAS